MDYYKILGLERGASDKEIKSAYRKLAKEFHPDRGGDAERFKEISEAYSILSDPQSKGNYDRFGSANSNNNGGFNMEDIFSNFENMFSGFGQTQGRANRRKFGKAIQTTIQVSMQDILFGATKSVEYFRDEKCVPCDGQGGTGKKTCTNCNGAGHQTQQVRTPFGVVESIVSCPVCSGDGEMILNPCQKCNGSGTVKGKHKADVNLPAGILGGMRMEIPLGGDYIRNGEYGSLYLNIDEISDPNIIRDGFDIIIKADISISTAVLGGDIIVPTPHGDMPIRIEPGTQGGHHYEYSNKGVPELTGNGTVYNTGDMIIIAEVSIPTEISEEQKELFTKIKELENGKN